MVDISFDMFFDAPGVLRKVKDGTKSALSKFGAFVWRRAKSSIRRRKKPSQPGQPPSSHAGQLRDLLFFGYDVTTETVVVGPQLFKSKTNPTVPELLELGGRSVTWKGTPALYRAFPFMKPALDAEQDNFSGMFAGSVGG